ncbi:unnamed protein product [Brassica napus]|uniref:(rape) hypothetical protein n=1 Tax=Brassica napus TaxID=3708 RepID=A0A816P1H9_BRANA|nr:unnamed protein product [Brassica napus]
MGDSQKNKEKGGWDPDLKKYTAPDEVWDEYLKKHPTHKHLRYDSVEKYEDLQIIFGNGVATGGFAIGMGDSTDACTFRVEDISQTRENVNLHQSSDEVFELSSQQPSTEYGMSAFPCTGSKDRAEKLHPRKRSRREADTNADKLKSDQDDSMIIIPNLDNHIRFKAITLIHSLGMKSVFNDMTIEERFGWIESNRSSL